MSAANKYTFLVYAPDYTDGEAFSRRLAVRPQHLEGAKKLIGSGVLRTSCTVPYLYRPVSHLVTGIGGALVAPETLETENRKLIGSMMVFEAENLAAVRSIVESDIYWASNVVSFSNLAMLYVSSC